MKQTQATTITTILDHLAKQAVERWGSDLVSIVLFGSFARGDPHPYSDIDLLLVVENLPGGWRERSTSELAMERLGLQRGRPLQVILVEPTEVHFAVDTIMPLLLEIREGFHCLFDRERFFQNEMVRLEETLVVRGVHRLAEHKWEVPELASS
ncbi:MAG: nucleotidyltransferase domain-containing protein [Chloroflexota bacterium]|nr:nucleotidyltransferase domain-containing protein [Chloroflexota bacterium]